MKKILLSTFAIIAFCLSLSAKETIAKGKTYSAFGDYRIETSEKTFILSGKKLDTYTVSYDSSNVILTIAVDKSSKCRKYYVLSDALSIQYVCNNKSFGITKLDKIIKKDGYETNKSALNKEAFFHQRIITDGNGNDLENTKLIASYFPFLINNQIV
jgi:hypothetical protein